MRAHDRAPDACARLTAMVRTFAESARRPAVDGGWLAPGAAVRDDGGVYAAVTPLHRAS